MFPVLLFTGSCRSSQSPKTQDEIGYTLTQKLGKDFEELPNSSGEYVLYIQAANEGSPESILTFLVLNLASNEIVIERKFAPGHVKLRAVM
jgi:hypothetical protein